VSGHALQVDADTSQQIYQSFRGADMLESDGRLQRDPRCAQRCKLASKHVAKLNIVLADTCVCLNRATVREWHALLKQKVPAILSLEADRSPVFEELNVLWAGACCCARSLAYDKQRAPTNACTCCRS
jgi:hypothetical protein